MSSTPGDDKASASHVDNISPRVDSDPVVSHQHGDEEIVEVLQHTGEEVGMTWRTIAAAIVSPFHSFSCFFFFKKKNKTILSAKDTQMLTCDF